MQGPKGDKGMKGAKGGFGKTGLPASDKYIKFNIHCILLHNIFLFSHV